MSEDTESDQISSCVSCDDDLESDDLSYRVVYGRFKHVRDDTIATSQNVRVYDEKQGANEKYYCFDCYREEFFREKAAHFEYETPEELWSILEASDGRLVCDAKPMTVGGRGWFRVVDGNLEARHSVHVYGDEDDDWDIGFETEPTPNFGEEEFMEFFDEDREFKLVYLKPLEETPLVAGMNRTLTVVAKR